VAYYSAKGDPASGFEAALLAAALTPLTGGDDIAVLAYSRLHEATLQLPGVGEVYPGEYAGLALASAAAWTLALALVLWRVAARRDY